VAEAARARGSTGSAQKHQGDAGWLLSWHMGVCRLDKNCLVPMQPASKGLKDT
jgi:hypothetical protein